MELLTCPFCGCRVQASEAVLGRSIRCFGCKQSFVATTEPPSPPTRSAPPRPHSADAAEEDGNEEHGPFCPGCGRHITWHAVVCPHCGEELEQEFAAGRRNLNLLRRDQEPHRAGLILSLGNVSMIVGGLSLCTFGVGAAISVPLGMLALVMANHDLERMRQGHMDASGKARTETGRTGGIAGMILGLIFATFYALIYLAG